MSRLLEELRGGATSQLSRIRIAKAQAQCRRPGWCASGIRGKSFRLPMARSLFDIAEVQGYIGDRDAGSVRCSGLERLAC